MRDLISIHTSNLGNHEVKTVNARDLHEFLGVKRKFSDWMRYQIHRARLVEGRDYLVHIFVTQVPHQGGTRDSRSTEYTLTVDAAKCIGMMSGTDKGFEIRDYFLECERIALSTPSITLELHRRVMAYERIEKLTAEVAKRAARDMNERKKALRTYLRAELKMLQEITQLRLFLSGNSGGVQ